MNRRLFVAATTLVMAACAHQPEQDPLRNTKKLFAEGHTTLYRNGAFQVPMTTIHLIPPGPSAVDLAGELAGKRARQSFLDSVKHARESIDVASSGIDKSLSAAGAIHRGAGAIAESTRPVTRFGAQLAGAAPEAGAAIIGASVSYAAPATYRAVSGAGERLAESSLGAGGAMSAATDRTASTLVSGSVELAGNISRGSRDASRRHAAFAAERFVKGYAAVPAKLGKRAHAIGEAASLDHFVSAYQRSNEWRGNASNRFADVLVDTTRNYAGDVGRAFGAAADELRRGAQDSGYTLAVLKSLRWVLQGVLWDATIKPVGKMTLATVGYVTVNAVAFPVLVTVNEAGAVANLAVQVTWNTAASAYEVVAPSGTAAVAGLFSAVELLGGQLAAGGTLVAGAAAGGGTYVAGKSAAAATAAGGYVAGKTVQYVAAPLSAAGVAVGGTTVGVVAMPVTAAAGAGVALTGAAAEGSTRIAGAAAAGTVAAGGSVLSVAAGAALGSYEIAKAMVVPTGHVLGAGVVLSYGTVTQLGAQTVLLVADASYMVLSLEGPRWVLYAVRGKVDNGENLPVGAVLDLKAMQGAGETLYAVPASDEEVKRVVESVYGELPAINPAEEEAPQ